MRRLSEALESRVEISDGLVDVVEKMLLNKEIEDVRGRK